MFSTEIWGVDVNIIAIALAVLVNIIFGTLWYGPLFGKLWLKLTNKKKDSLKFEPKDMLSSVFIALLMATGLNSVIQFAAEVSELGTLLNIFSTAGMISFTFILPPLLNEVVWEERNLKLILLNFMHQYFTYILMGIVLSFFVL